MIRDKTSLYSYIRRKFADGRRAELSGLAAAPILFILIAAAIFFAPAETFPKKMRSVRTIRPAGFPISIMLEQHEGVLTSAWLRTPAGPTELGMAAGLSFLTDAIYLSKADKDSKDDLLWRISCTGGAGDGLHIWIGMNTHNPTVYVMTTPFRFSRWDALPAKLLVPKGTALYAAPATPKYGGADAYCGRESYSFVYTIRMTPNGPAFVPVPSVYSQLATLLKAGIRGEFDPVKRLTYIKMIKEFDSLAEGNPPQTETILNFQAEKIGTLTIDR